jgi:hypothetical protein
MNPVAQVESLHARGSENKDEGVLEVELSPQELLALSQPRSPGKRRAIPEIGSDVQLRVAAERSTVPDKVPSIARRSPVFASSAIGASIIVAAVIAAFIADQGPRTEPMNTAAKAVAPPVTALATPAAISEPVPSPVRFRNPFDRTEIFEFPAGTSPAEARDKVADLLMKRAQERQGQKYRRVAMTHPSGADTR